MSDTPEEKVVQEIPVFDYGSINDDHKAAASEIAQFLQSNGLTDAANALRVRFKLKEVAKMDLDASPFIAACKLAGIYCAVQGYVQEGFDDQAMQYPLVAICEDLRNLEKLVPVIKEMKL